MLNIYNKGQYRSGEWAKHLRPYLKKVGNRRWRRTASRLGYTDLEINEISSPQIKTKSKTTKKIKVKFKCRLIGDRTYSYWAKYNSLRAANDAMKRNNVIEAKIIK